MAKTYSGGIITATGFKLNDPQPIVDYMVVDFLADLNLVENQFIGMTTFVKEDDTMYVKKSSGWKAVGSGEGSLVYADGITITGDGSQASPLVAQIPEETDPVFNSSQAKNITSTHISVLNNTSGTNTGDETSETIKSKLGISVLSGSNTGDQDLSGYSVTSHNHSLSSLSEKSYNSLSDKPSIPEAQVNADWNATEGVAEILNKPTIPTIPALAEVATSGSYNDLSHTPTIPSIAGLMVESEYTGQSATKSVAVAEEALYSEKADKDSFGRIIHDTYALKDSGITPPETETITLTNTSPLHTITDSTAPVLIVINNASTGGDVYLSGNLSYDKSITIQIFGNDTLISSHNGSNTYQDKDTVFASFEVATATWFVTDTEITVIPDYSDMTVDAMLDDPTITPKPGYIYVSGVVFTINTLVFIKSTSTPSQIGIYKVYSAIAGGSNMHLIAAGTALHTVRVKGGDVWYSQYDGANAVTLLFERITVEKLAITKQGFNGELSPVVYPVDRQRTIIGYKLGSNATDFSVTINSVNYTKADVTNVVVPVNTEIKINDVTILAGNDTGNVVLILK